MCTGDTTLEKARTVDGKLVRGVDGWGVTHECRDYDSIFNFAEAYRTRNISGIDWYPALRLWEIPLYEA